MEKRFMYARALKGYMLGCLFTGAVLAASSDGALTFHPINWRVLLSASGKLNDLVVAIGRGGDYEAALDQIGFAERPGQPRLGDEGSLIAAAQQRSRKIKILLGIDRKHDWSGTTSTALNGRKVFVCIQVEPFQPATVGLSEEGSLEELHNMLIERLRAGSAQGRYSVKATKACYYVQCSDFFGKPVDIALDREIGEIPADKVAFLSVSVTLKPGTASDLPEASPTPLRDSPRVGVDGRVLETVGWCCIAAAVVVGGRVVLQKKPALLKGKRSRR